MAFTLNTKVVGAESPGDGSVISLSAAPAAVQAAIKAAAGTGTVLQVEEDVAINLHPS